MQLHINPIHKQGHWDRHQRGLAEQNKLRLKDRDWLRKHVEYEATGTPRGSAARRLLTIFVVYTV